MAAMFAGHNYLADAYNKTRYIVIASALIRARRPAGKLLLSTRLSATRQFQLAEVDCEIPVGGRAGRKTRSRNCGRCLVIDNNSFCCGYYMAGWLVGAI